MTWTGGCLCGAVRFRTESEPTWVAHCHCGMCRKHFGGVMGSFVGFPDGAIEWQGEPRARYSSSEGAQRAFCPRCGSTLTFERGERIDVAVGALDQPERLRPGDDPDNCHIFYAERLPWLEIVDGLPRHDGWQEGDGQ